MTAFKRLVSYGFWKAGLMSDPEAILENAGNWVTEAKREATRDKRLAQAVGWLAEGKPRNWKYMKDWR